eukprot:Blabericola_migrator_1__9993@NODE_552_length_7652_cov_40_220040_g145_i2_p2_GENE_NODE_552_length_7652_cov_40_220040_g145_i2NODE_552_length_7652_cov_40_220040_g145_i2_p2_ORF_typecomplete_len488_score78_00_NODE_552_length_7652_cov_40_220040_g145_i229024365
MSQQYMRMQQQQRQPMDQQQQYNMAVAMNKQRPRGMAPPTSAQPMAARQQFDPKMAAVMGSRPMGGPPPAASPKQPPALRMPAAMSAPVNYRPGQPMQRPPFTGAAAGRPQGDIPAGVRPDAAAFFQRPPANFQVHPRPGAPGFPRPAGGASVAARPSQMATGPQQYVAALIERVKSEKEILMGDQEAYENSKKRPLENEEKLFWDFPLPARLIAGVSLLEADAALTVGHVMGGTIDVWETLDPIPSPMSCGGQSMGRFGGIESYRPGLNPALQTPQDFLYTECTLMGLINEKAAPQALPALCKLLQSICDVSLKGIWKDECWRIDADSTAATGSFLQSGSKSSREVWLRRYLLPEHLRNVFAMRIYSAQYLAMPAGFPTNARRVKETTVSPSITLILDGIGFQRAPPNDVFVRGVLYHIDSGTNRHLIVSCLKFYSSRLMNEDMFPDKVFIEAKGRTEKDSQMNAIGTALTDLAQKLEPHVHLMKL